MNLRISCWVRRGFLRLWRLILESC